MRFLHAGHGEERYRHREEPRQPDGRNDPRRVDGNSCRCTGYHNIVKAVQAGAQAMGR
jgi:aerobic-type carbon monoxide dehydrogenase small subunit (CoxS/CutS family)